MSIQIEFKFENANDFTEVPSGSIDVTSGQGATLGFVDATSQFFFNDFSNTSSYTPSPKVSVESGVLTQSDMRPQDATFGATFTNTIGANWANSFRIAAPAGGASVESGELNLTGGTKYVTYVGSGNVNFPQQGAIRFLYKPNYSGIPSAVHYFYSISRGNGDARNEFYLYHSSGNGNIFSRMRNASGADIYSTAVGNFLPNSGQTYEFELNYDLDAGETRLFIDGIQFGNTISGAGVRDTNIDLYRLGANIAGSQITNASFNDLVYFSSVQHTSDYTPDGPLPETIYSQEIYRLPTYSYGGNGDIQALTAIQSTTTNSVTFALNGLYFDGSSWTETNCTNAQANDLAAINANIAGFSATNSFYIDVVFNNVETPGAVENFNIFYTGQQYNQDVPNIRPNASFFTDSVCNFIDSADTTSASNIGYQLNVNSVDFYFDGSSWVQAESSNQTNTNSQVAMNLSNFDFSGGARFFFKSYLTTDSADFTPSLFSYKVDYSFNGGDPSSLSTVNVFGYIYDNDNTPINGVSVVAELKDEAVFGNIQFSKSKSQSLTNSFGYWELELVPSAIMGEGTKFYNFTFSGGGTNFSVGKILPNSESLAWGSF